MSSFNQLHGLAKEQLPAALGQTTSANSLSIVLASDQSAIPITGSITATNASVGTTGSAVPGSASAAGGKDGSGNLQILKVSSAGVLSVDGSAVTQPVSAASLPLPTGAATAAKQPALGTAGSASTDVITVQGIASMTALKVDGSTVTQPISAASLPLPSGAATSAKQPALGTAGSASTDVLTVQGIASMTALKVDGSSFTQPISAAALPLPSGAATSAKQPALGTAGSASADVITVQGIASMTALTTDQTTTTATFQAEGSIAGTSLTASYATVLTTGGTMKWLALRNSCDKTVVVSLDGGTTAHFVLEANEAISIDLKSLGLSVAGSVNLQAKHNGSTPTTGSIRINGAR